MDLVRLLDRAADCKVRWLSLRRFESCPAHLKGEQADKGPGYRIRYLLDRCPPDVVYLLRTDGKNGQLSRLPAVPPGGMT